MLAIRFIITLIITATISNAYKLINQPANNDSEELLEIPDMELVNDNSVATESQLKFENLKINYQEGFQVSKIFKEAHQKLGHAKSLNDISAEAKKINQEIEYMLAQFKYFYTSFESNSRKNSKI